MRYNVASAINLAILISGIVIGVFLAPHFTWTSVVTSKAANGGHFKTGQRMWAGTRWFYANFSCSGKSVFVRQLRGPHLRTWP
jgi:hypothetical protein